MPQIQIIHTMSTGGALHSVIMDKLVERLNNRFSLKKVDRPSPDTIIFSGSQLGRFTLSKVSGTIKATLDGDYITFVIEGETDTSKFWWIVATIAVILDFAGAPSAVFLPWYAASGFSVVCYLFNMNHPKQDLADAVEYVDHLVHQKG